MRFVRQMWLALLAGLWVCPCVTASAQPSQRSVLVLDQSSAGLPFNTALASAIRSTLNAASKQPLSFYSEISTPTVSSAADTRRISRDSSTRSIATGTSTSSWPSAFPHSISFCGIAPRYGHRLR
jgi:pyridoxine/pyridoxamine 5'-phosphate oxidase